MNNPGESRTAVPPDEPRRPELRLKRHPGRLKRSGLRHILKCLDTGRVSQVLAIEDEEMSVATTTGKKEGPKGKKPTAERISGADVVVSHGSRPIADLRRSRRMTATCSSVVTSLPPGCSPWWPLSWTARERSPV